MKGAAGNGSNAVWPALFMTAAIHLGGLGLALFAPSLFPERLQISEVYQVELYSALEAQPEPQSASPPVQAEVESPAITIPPPPAIAPAKVQPKPTTATPVPPPTQPKAISLSPLKEQLVRETREREEQADRNRQVANRVTQLKLDLQQQQAEEKAREAGRLAREAIAETYRVATPHVPLPEGSITKPRFQESTAQGTGGSAKEVNPKIQAAYEARLKGHIGRQWSLPDLQGWDKSLKTIISIKMKSNGMVAVGGITIATTSGNPRFDKEARKAVTNSLPLPPLPKEFGTNSEEIVVTFTPVGLK